MAPGADGLASVQHEVRLAARALARHGLVHAYGHCSRRLDGQRFLVCAAQPMGLIGVGEPGTIVPVEGELPDGVLGEVRIHQQIYRLRPDVQGVVRSMPRQLMTLGSARRVPRPRHGFGAYFHTGIALWDDPQLVRNDASATALAEHLGPLRALVMRGNGAIVAAESLVKAVVLTWYLEDAARLELEVLAAGLEAESVVLGDAECRQRATDAGRIFERMWDYLTAGDAELELGSEAR
ncbi:MAG: class II aldolase/adducin family protein [Candidatus Competibacteraceae bacterium]|nr:class II aldolase/adducin family protein [Candidatus Competibacteraceae bacterium]MCB1810620.1 class II aldolase/adducin family protein [Candidatus Competibacteraceae bacterium]